ncbi:MerR family transcriptional regulator [Neisseriaceae bacterium PsAf]|nr:MerR family transcriptional regulator [Neisseriaceae bacterium PsAf]
MKISELSKLSGVPASSIRYYEQINLISKPKRHKNGYREYTEHDFQQLFLIKQAQQIGFSLTEIKELLPLNINIWEHDKLIETLTHKVEEIQQLEQKITKNKQILLNLIDAVNNKPDDINCEQNARRIFNLYTPIK